ncbi:MAG: hypothetical protein Q7W13_04640 [Bacteroidia bacterium]|nr:hypothetical protein [Bacteroidia bacterium]
MKILIKYFSILLLLNICGIVTPEKSTAQGVSFQIFYDNLSPYGHWVDYPNYGFVWIPMVDADFFPYGSNGHWVFTNYGWTWVSHYSWGWAPFHYGRWTYDDYYGWFWIPDNMWGPAWVAWRSSPGYYGWAPMGPNISINVVIIGGYNPPPDHWVFVPNNYMGQDDINHYYGPRKNNQVYIDNSTVINNTYVDNSTRNTYISGPGKEDVQKVTGGRVKAVEIVENSKPGQSLENDKFKIYRPVITKSDNKEERPSKITDRKDIKPMSERKSMDPKVGEEPRKEPAIDKPAQKDIRQKQNVPNDLERKEPIQRKEEIKIKPEKRAVEPKPTQKEKELKQNVPMDNREKEQPIQPKREVAPQPVPIQREQPEKRQEPKQQNVQPKANPTVAPRVAEPKTNVNQPAPSVPRTEQKTKQKPRDK